MDEEIQLIFVIEPVMGYSMAFHDVSDNNRMVIYVVMSCIPFGNKWRVNLVRSGV